MPDEWLTAGTLEPVEASVAQLSATLRRDRGPRGPGRPRRRDSWSAIPHSGMLPAADGAALAGLAPPCADPGGLTAEQIAGLSRSLAADADMLQSAWGPCPAWPACSASGRP